MQLNQEKTDSLRKLLLHRMLDLEGEIPAYFPPVIYDDSLNANARYETDTIYLGSPQIDFRIEDDLISLIWHEYKHYLQEVAGHYPVQKDSAGQIVQWETDEWFELKPSPHRIEQSLESYRRQLEGEDLSDQDKAGLLAIMARDLSQAQLIPFRYAPSNLSLAEIEAYQWQLDAEKQGLYVLSESAREEIKSRFLHHQSVYKRRVDYEVRFGILPTGAPQVE